ncbi:DUF748 repeat protein [Citrifermentans bemidjiense Bem]|uniref:DUF748 repeat protein n=1 Tax=Citrifermentans bemidjiense (strain ATCC BAA-1014 / DSM 16622 / JCM 12645 / Bem) TaxID=404380 RepID=B5ECC6_CITBB|nr:DUF748 domain-containing protein [Citrifermentans bemidjiense]ACH37554.1 DUF748 repeat protein [Citrifermentans bemidjiense Bem]
MSKPTKYILISAAIVTSIIVFVTALLPIIVRNKTVSTLKEATGREVHLSSVSINPFTLTVTVNDFAIAEKTGPPLVAFRKAKASLALASVYKRALILSEIVLDTPSVSLVRTAPNRFNFSDIIDRQPKGKAPEQGKPFLFSLNNISVKNGSIEFDDRMTAGGRKHTVRDLQITIPFISNIPYLADRYVDPRLAAVVNGAPFNFTGKLKPLSKSLETSVHIGLKGLNLPQYLAYAPVPPPVDLTSGRLTLDMDLAYRVSADKKPELILKGGAGLAEVRVNLLDGKPLLRLPSLELKADRLEVLAKSFEFNSIALNGLELFIDRDSNGRWMYDRILGATEKPKEPKEPKAAKDGEKEGKTTFAARSFVSSNGTVHFHDAIPKGGFTSTVSDLNLALKEFSTKPGGSASYDLSLLADDATIKSRGQFALTPLSLTASIQLAEAKVGRAWPYLRQYLTAPVQGTVGLSAEILYSELEGLRVQKGDLAIAGLSTRYGSKEGFDLATLQVKDASFRQSANRLEVGEVRLSGGNLSLSREADGTLSPLSLLAEQPKSKPVPPRKPRREASDKSKEFAYRVQRLQLDGFKLAFTDKTYEEPPRFTLKNTSLTLSNLQGPKFAPMPMTFASTYGKGAGLKARGTLTPAPFRYQGMMSVARLPIRDFEPYFPDSFNFSVIGGTADLSLNLDVAARDGKTKGHFRGSAGVRDFQSIDAVGDQDLLKWESLQFDEFQGELEPFSLNIRQVALNDVYSRVIVRKDGSLNLQDLVKSEAPQPAAAAPVSAMQPPRVATATAPAVPAPTGATSPPKAAPPARQVSVGSVTIQNGTLSFTDNHLPQTFNSTFYNLGGRVSGLSSEESKFADVDLRGNLENHSPMQITGRLNPLRDDLFVDLKISFRDIELSPVTPYSGTYLGYEIDKGKLFLDLKYLIEKKQLSSENRVFIDQFTFGKKVDSNQATNLPVRLAIALLKDRKGEIHLDLPVTGRTDDPQFSIWGLVGQVLKNLLVKAATSPFALLSSLTGGGQDFSTVQFEPGSSILSQGEGQKLEKLAKVLVDRPGVKMELKGFVDKAKDPEGYRQELLERKLRHEKYLYQAKEQKAKELKEGESGETVKLSDEEYKTFLKAVYKKEKFPKPRNALGLVKDLPANEMRKLIIANTVVAEADLQSLARERAATVFNYLVAKGGLPPERLFQGTEDIYHPPAQESAVRSRVEFNAIAR